MNVFELRNRLITDYGHFVRGFMHIQDARICDKVEEELRTGLLWPEPLIQLNPSFEPGAWLDALVDDGILHAECRKIFRKGKSPSESAELGKPLRLHTHQTEATQVARAGHNYVLTTGTGSGKSLVYIIPIAGRYLTVHKQQFVPGDRGRILLPLVFGRKCGQEYYCIRVSRSPETRKRVCTPRELSDYLSDAEEGEAGFLYASATDPWALDTEAVIQRLPDDWLEEHRGALRVRANRRRYLPQAVRLGCDGSSSRSIGNG